MREQINTLRSIKDIEREIRTLEERERLITKPALTDFAYITELHDIYLDVTGEDTANYEVRQKFLFIITYLYCPKYIVVNTRRKFLRASLAKIFNYITPAMLSNTITTGIFRFWHYKDFRSDVFAIFDAMKEEIKEKNTFLYEKLKNY